MQTSTAAVQRRRSTFSLRKILPAMALVTRVSEAEAGATRLRLRWFKARSREKKARARKPTPKKKSGQVRTARMAPLRPERARISSRSPMDFMAAAVSTSPAVEQRTMAAIMAAAAQNPVIEAGAGIVIAVAPPRLERRVPRRREIVLQAEVSPLQTPRSPASES